MHDKMNLPEDLIFDESFQDYVLKKDPAAVAKWSGWINEHPEHVDDFHKAKEILLSVKIRPYPLSKDKFEEDLKRLINAIHGNTQPKIARGVSVNFLQQYAGRVAAAVTVSIAAAVMVYFVFLNGGTNAPETKAPVSLVKTSPAGTKTTVTLPDGTKVKLNSESSLEYFDNFETNRTVHLEGEAFFEVSEDSLRPFIIYSNALEVRVLGTSFNVKSYLDDEDIEVAVATGKVAVRKQNAGDQDPVLLKPMEKATYSKARDVIATSGFDMDEAFGWRNGVLVFNNSDFSEIVKALGRWYGVEFQVDEEVHIQKGYTGKFQNEALNHVLEGLSFSLGFKYRIQEQKVKIFK